MNKQTEPTTEKPLSTIIHMLGGRHVMNDIPVDIGELHVDDNDIIHVNVLQGSLVITKLGHYVLIDGTDYVVKLKRSGKTSIYVLTCHGGIIQLDDDCALAVVPFVQDGMMNAYIKPVQGVEFTAIMDFIEGKFKRLPESRPLFNTGIPNMAVKVH